MGTNKSVVISFSIAILLLLSLLLLLTYNSKTNGIMGTPINKTPEVPMGFSKNNPEPFYFEKFANTPGTSVADIDNKQRDPSMASAGIGNFQASESSGDGVFSQTLQTSPQSQSNNSEGQFASFETNNEMKEEHGMQGMQSCYPRDRLTADDLLPKDAANSKWAQINPAGSGSVGDQNFLSAGYHVGVNTVGQSLRNANLQLRSVIPNPQNAVGPWLISTIEPDIRQNTLEIGSSASY